MLYLLFNRIKTHLVTHRFAMCIFFVGIFTSTMFFTYFYSEFVKGVLMGQGATEEMATCRTYVGYHVPLSDERFRQLEEKYRVTYGFMRKITIDKCDDVIDARYLPEGDHTYIYVVARKDNKFDEGTIWGNCDVSEKSNSISLPSDIRYINSTKLREQGYGIINLRDVEFRITGIHATASDAYINYDYAYEQNLYVDRIDVMTYDYKNIESLQPVIDELNEMFWGTAEPLLGGTVDALISQSKKNLLRGIGILAIALFSFLFVLKYIFDMDRRENVIERIVGATKVKVGFIAYCEVMLLTSVGTVIAFAVHSVFYKTIFKYISDFDMGVSLNLSDYASLLGVIVAAMTIVAIPLIWSVCHQKMTVVE